MGRQGGAGHRPAASSMRGKKGMGHPPDTGRSLAPCGLRWRKQGARPAERVPAKVRSISEFWPAGRRWCYSGAAEQLPAGRRRMTGPPSQVLTINGVEVDLAAEVLRDMHGVTVPLRPQAFAVLRHLLGNPGRLVAKDELMARRLAGDRGHRRQPGAMRPRNPPGAARRVAVMLRTVPAARLPPGAAGASAASAAPVRARRWRLAAAAIAMGPLLGLAAAAWNRAPPVPAGLSVAVLPFDDFDGDARQVRFADAFTEDLITELARTDGLMVIARNSVEAYADKADRRARDRPRTRGHPCAGGQPRAAAGPHPGHGAAHRRRHRRSCLVRTLRPARRRSFRRARRGARPAGRHPDRLRRTALARLDRGGEAPPAAGSEGLRLHADG